jgi:hypothetical protein
MTWVAPFVRMPLVWERAYGGADRTDNGSSADMRNPVGTGYRASGSVKPIAGTPLPNVEDPRMLITGPSDAPAPAGFAAIAPSWEPRKSYAGTYDESWQRSRAPYVPVDFDSRYFHCAPVDQVFTTPLSGGEPIEVHGAVPEGVLRFALPRVAVRIRFRREQGEEDRRASLETVQIEPDAKRLVMVWRAALRADKAVLKIREVAASLTSA